MADFNRKKLQVFVSSTFNDLIKERQAEVEAISDHLTIRQRMPTLVINAPKYQVRAQSYRSFSQTMRTGIAHDYALNSKILPLAKKASKVILLDKSDRRKATGVINRIVPTGAKAGNGIPRFDIHVSLVQECGYQSEALNRNGVAII